MPIIKVTAADVLRGKLLDEAWYGLVIKGASDWKKAKTGDSVNCTVTFLVENTEGKEIDYVINSTGLGFHVPLFSALAGKKLDPKDLEIDTSDWAGKKVDGKIKQDLYDGRLNNKIVDFVPYGQGKSQTAPF